MATAKKEGTAVVVLSGGQDSALCLAIASEAHRNVTCIHYSYGQRHAVEKEYAEKLCLFFGASFLHLPLNLVSSSALLTPDKDISCVEENTSDSLPPASYVPGRNALFLTMGHAVAQELKATHIYTGVCQTDYSGYPDCRSLFIRALQDALNIGYETEITIHTPLMYLTKAQTFQKARDLGEMVLAVILELTISCYEGVTTYNEWGRGCARCPTCLLRIKGWQEFLTSHNAS